MVVLNATRTKLALKYILNSGKGYTASLWKERAKIPKDLALVFALHFLKLSFCSKAKMIKITMMCLHAISEQNAYSCLSANLWQQKVTLPLHLAKTWKLLRTSLKANLFIFINKLKENQDISNIRYSCCRYTREWELLEINHLPLWFIWVKITGILIFKLREAWTGHRFQHITFHTAFYFDTKVLV